MQDEILLQTPQGEVPLTELIQSLQHPVQVIIDAINDFVADLTTSPAWVSSEPTPAEVA